MTPNTILTRKEEQLRYGKTLTLIRSSDNLEQQLCGSLGEWHVSKLVQDQQVCIFALFFCLILGPFFSLPGRKCVLLSNRHSMTGLERFTFTRIMFLGNRGKQVATGIEKTGKSDVSNRRTTQQPFISKFDENLIP